MRGAHARTALGAALAFGAIPAYLFVVDAGALRRSVTEYLFGPPSLDARIYPVVLGLALVFLGGAALAAAPLWVALGRIERRWPRAFDFSKSLTSLVYLPIAAILGMTAGVQQLVALSHEPTVYLPHALLALLTAVFSLLLLLDTVSVVGLRVEGGVLMVRGFPRSRTIPLTRIRAVRRERGRVYVDAASERVVLPADELVAVAPGEGLGHWDGPMSDPGRFAPLARYLQGLVPKHEAAEPDGTPSIPAEADPSASA